MIKVENIIKSFGPLTVLKGIDLMVAEHEIISIVGASGAGKTTLLQIIGTLSRAGSGRVLIKDIDVFNMKEKADTKLTSTTQVAEGTFNSNVSSVMEYSALNTIIYQDMKLKGDVFSIGQTRLYTGDIEFDMGINVKMIQWNFEVQDATNTALSPSWVKVNQFIALPYLGMKYYLYGFVAYANVSTLSLSETDSTSVQAGMDFPITGGLYLSVGYVYEQFKAVEKLDTVDFQTSGYKISAKYAF